MYTGTHAKLITANWKARALGKTTKYRSITFNDLLRSFDLSTCLEIHTTHIADLYGFSIGRILLVLDLLFRATSKKKRYQNADIIDSLKMRISSTIDINLKLFRHFYCIIKLFCRSIAMFFFIFSLSISLSHSFSISFRLKR